MNLTILLRRIGTFALCISPFIVISLVLLIRDPLVWPDEATLSDIAKNLLNHGVIATNLPGSLVPGLSTRAFIYPPVYFFLHAGWISVFGSSLESVRSLSLVISIAVLVTASLLMRIFLHSDRWTYVAIFLLSLDLGFGRSARIGRMEILIELWMLLSAWLYLTAMQRSSGFRLILSGIFAGLSVMTHPGGIAVIAILGLTHIIVGKPLKHMFSDIILFILPVIIFITLWLLSNINYMNYIFTQLSYQFSDKSNYGPYVVQLFQEPQTILYVFIYLIGIGMFFASAKKIPTLYRVVISTGIIVMTVAQVVGKIQWYLLYIQPWYVIAVVLGVYHMKSRFKAITVVYFFLLIFASAWVYADIWYSANFTPQAYHAFTAEISRRLPPKSSVLITTIPDPYFDLSKRADLKLTEFSTGPIPLTLYEASMNSISIVVVNFIPIDWFRLYLEKNKLIVIPIRQKKNGYETNIVVLKPVNQRVSVIE